MRRIVLAYLLAVSVLSSTKSIAQDDDVQAIFIMKGECTTAVVNSKAENSCMGLLSHTVFKSGTLLFMFNFLKSETDFFTLKFFGDSEINRGENAKIMPVSYIEINSPNTKKSYKAVGKCIFQNPYNQVPALIECEAETENGIMKGKFLTDGQDPESF
ncbi:hypothetical protein [Acinetobacter bereziniae]|uniref:hypothetical protein n=1 Tax=Acinetobacter bereziniae TaxID=106648 RepID=UPI001250C2FB|nr:hypothetical protein [Acinetobacter bereziniae]